MKLEYKKSLPTRKPTISLVGAITCLFLIFISSVSVSKAAGGPFAYIANFQSQDLTVIDTSTDTSISTITGVGDARGVAVNSSGTRVYVSSFSAQKISVIDTTTNTIIATINLGVNPQRLSINPAGTRVYVPAPQGSNAGVVKVIDTTTNTVIETISVGVEPRGSVISPDGLRVYVTNVLSNDVTVIDAITNSVTATIGAGTQPSGIAVSPNGLRIYVTNVQSNDVTVIDTTTNNVIATIPVGVNPFAVAVNPTGTSVYVSNASSNTVSVIDTAMNTVIASVTAGNQPWGIAVNPSGTKVYVANRASDDTTVIDTTTNTVVATIPVGDAPESEGLFIGPVPNQLPVAIDNSYTTSEDTPLNVPAGPPVTTIQPILPADLQLSTGTPRSEPAPVTFDGSRYLVVFTQDTDIVGQFVDTSGAASGSLFTIASGTGLQIQADLAFNGSSYLVVYYDDPNSDVFGQVVDPSGNLVGSPLLIKNGGSLSNPAIASDGSNFLVVWQDGRDFGINGYDIYGQLVDVNGAGTASLNGTDFFISVLAAENQFYPAVAFGNTDYLVSWTNDVAVNAGQFDIRGALVSPAGLVGTAFDISTATGLQGTRAAGIAFDGSNFLVVFDDNRAGSVDVYGARISAAGELLDGPATTGGIEISADPGFGSPHRPQVAYVGNAWLVVWGGTQIEGARVSASGAVLDNPDVALFVTPDSQWDPALAFDGTHALLTWRNNINTKFAQLVHEVTLAPGSFLSNDSDPDGDPLTAVLDTATSHGSLTLNSDGSFVYSPTPDFCGVDGFTYHANDGQTASNLATVTLNVTCVNDAPTANDDNYNATEDVTLNIPAPGVLEGDSDADEDTLTAILDTTTSSGSLTLNSDGSFVYTPAPDFCGEDGFIYHAHEGLAASNLATVTLNITCVNDTPTADDDSYPATEDVPLNVPAPGVLEGDSDADGDSLTAVLDTTTSNGSLSLNSDGAFAYTPNLNFCGIDSFTYHANDGMADSNVATVTLNVTCINDAPVADNDSYTVTEDNLLSVVVPGVLDGDTDVENDPLTAVLATSPGNGSVTLNSDGSFDYMPDPDFCGTDSFTYHANDGLAASNLATVTIYLECINDAPVADNDNYSATEDTPLNVSTPGVLVGDTDVDGNSLTAVLNSTTNNGSLILNSNGVFAYTPNPDFCGMDIFTYHASDGQADSNIATGTIDVACVNDNPVAGDDNDSTDEDTAVTLEVLANDFDVDGDGLTIAGVSQGNNGGITNNGTDVTYNPAPNFCGSDNFTYTINDGNGGTATANVTVNITCINDAPVANDDNYNATEDTPLNVSAPGVLVDDSDVDGDSLTAVLNTSTSNGTLVLNANGSFTYTPAANYCGSDSFTYHANDGLVDSNVANVTLVVTCINDVPTADDDSYNTLENTLLNVPAPGVLEGDNDIDGDTLSAVLDTTPNHGTLSLNIDGSFTYAPAPGFCDASDSFTYHATDGAASSNIATVTILVICDNHAPTLAVDQIAITVDEGQTATNTGTVDDLDGDIVTLTASIGSIANNGNGTWSWSYSTNDGPTQSQVVTIFAEDNKGGTAQITFALSVDNVAPTIESISIPIAPVNINNQPIQANASFSDPAGDADEPYPCTVDYGDGTGALAGLVTGLTCTGPDHTYASAGIYVVTVSVTDKDGGTSITASDAFIVVYNPANGFVTGGGWFDSVPGNLLNDPSATGKANFGFNIQYKKYLPEPTGQIEFNLNTGNWNFHSDNYEWLVIYNATKATFQGSGTINGTGSYGFNITVIDGGQPGNIYDFIRIKIWDKVTGDVIYDTQLGDPVTAEPSTGLGGGNIVIHD